MALQRWYPFREVWRMDNTIDRLGREFNTGGYLGYRPMPLDVVQEDDKILIHASMPGVKPEEIQVTIEDGLLIVKGDTTAEHEEHNGNYLVRERRSGSFQRALRLPDTVDTGKAESRYKDGVLTIELPKTEAKQAKRLEVKVGQLGSGRRPRKGTQEARPPKGVGPLSLLPTRAQVSK